MVDIRHILCPVDFSDTSKAAMDDAVAIATWYEAQITAFHVYEPIIVPCTSLSSAAVYRGDEPQVVQPELQRLTKKLAAWCPTTGPAIHTLVEAGKPAGLIVERSVSLGTDLIVIGTHGASGFQRLLLGSVTEKVVRQSGRPVLTVPPRSSKTPGLPFRRVLCAVDRSDSALVGLQFAFSLAEHSHGALTILHVVEWLAGEPRVPLAAAQAFDISAYRSAREQDAAAWLEGLVPNSVRDWCTPRTRLGHGKAYVEILQAASDESADVIVIGVRGRDALDLMLFGSTANQVVRMASCPVLTIRS